MSEEDRMRECNVLIQIDLSKVNIKEVIEAEKALQKIGITFDAGAGFGFRDWEWDDSLNGPINVYFQDFKDEENDTSIPTQNSVNEYAGGLNSCQYCYRNYSRSEIIRVFGDMWWTGIYCSAQCMTKAKGEH